MSGLADKVVVVTGAARGAGRTHCERFADAGAHVIALDIGSAAADLASVAEAVRQRGRRCFVGLADVADLEAVRVEVDAGIAELRRLDVVVANAGVHCASVPSWEVTPADWARIIGVNLTGVWHTVTACVPHFGSAGGSVVIISSTNGLRGTANTAPYTSSKHAVVGLARTLANELGPKRIRVNTVHPVPSAPRWCSTRRRSSGFGPIWSTPTAQDAAEVLSARNLLAVPWVEPVDISNAVVFLASDEARYITGTQLVVDAGLTQKA